MKVLLILLGVVAFSNAYAAVWYVCPGAGANGETLRYGTGDGASPENCFDGFARAWASGRIRAGETLRVVSDFGAFYERMIVEDSGQSGFPIRIEGWSAVRGAPSMATLSTSVPIGGYQSFSGSTNYRATGYGWERVAGEVFRKVSHAIPHLLTEDGRSMTPVNGFGQTEAQIVASLGRGKYSVVPGVPNIIYYRSFSGASPYSHMVRMNDHRNDGAPGALFCEGKHDIDIRFIRVEMVYIGYAHKASRNAGLVLSNCSNVTVDNMYAGGNFIGIGINGGSNISIGKDVVGSNNAAAGIALEAAPFPVSSVVISGTYQFNNRFPAIAGDARAVGHIFDGDGISIGQSGGILRDITVQNAVVSYNGSPDGALRQGGSGIYLGTSASMTAGLSVTGTLVEFNHGCGLHLGPQWIGGKITSNVFRENVRGQASGTCLANVWVDFSTSGPFVPSVVANNSFVGNHGSRAISFNNSNPNNILEFRNNIFAYNLPYFGSPAKVADVVVSSSIYDNLMESNNIIFPTIGSAVYRGRAFTCEQINAGEWDLVTVNTGQGTLCVDPELTYVPGATSPAIANGACYGAGGCAELDFEGKPASSPPDIGAIQR